MYSWVHTKPKNTACGLKHFEMPQRLGILGCLATTWGRLTWPTCSSRVRKWVWRRWTSLWTTGRSIQVDKKELRILNISDCLSRPALPVQAPSHLGLDKQVSAEKRHRQNCSWVRSCQQLVCIYFHPISIARVDLCVVSSSNLWLFGCHQFKSRIDGQRRVTFPRVMLEIKFLAWQQLSSSYAPPPHSTRCKYALAIKPEGPFFWLDGAQ